MTWAAWLMGLAASLASRVLISLGFGIVSYAGLSMALSAALNAAKSSLGGMLPEVAQLAALAGLFTAASILAGGATASITLVALKRLSLRTGS